MKKAFLLFLLSGLAFTSLNAQNTPTTADRIVAMVNDHIILKSEIDQGIADYIRQAQFNNQEIPFSEELWYSFLEAEIDNYVLLEQARVDSITVTDSEVDQQMDRRIDQLVRQAGSEQAVEQAFGKSIVQLKADFREEFRMQMLTERVRQTKYQSIKITRPEVQEFFDSIPTDSLPTIPEQVALSHIVRLPKPKKDAKKASYDFAISLRDSIINHGVPLEDLAKRHGMDGSAQRGGQLPMMGLNELVAEYSAAASALKTGEISEVVETEFGFHIIRLDERVGDQIKTSHILIRVDSEQLDDATAIAELESIRDSLLTQDNLSFNDLAKRNSEDPSTATSGGKIIDPQTGERLIPLSRLDPALYRVVLLMEEIGEISEPKPFNPNNANAGKAYRIVRLDKQIPEHIASMEMDYERLKNIALQQKQTRVFQEWLDGLREEFYIEYRIPKMMAEGN